MRAGSSVRLGFFADPAMTGTLRYRGRFEANSKPPARLRLGAPVIRGKIEMENRDIRAALDLHWAASDANDFEVEHQIYRPTQ